MVLSKLHELPEIRDMYGDLQEIKDRQYSSVSLNFMGDTNGMIPTKWEQITEVRGPDVSILAEYFSKVDFAFDKDSARIKMTL